MRGTELEDGTSLGNNISKNRNFNNNSQWNLETLYNHIPFLKKVNEKFKKSSSRSKAKVVNSRAKADGSGKSGKSDKTGKSGNKTKTPEEKLLPLNKNTFQKEIALKPDTTLTVNHGKKSKRLIVKAKTTDGHDYPLKYKVIDDKKILSKNRDTVKVMLSVTPKPAIVTKWCISLRSRWLISS